MSKIITTTINPEQLESLDRLLRVLKDFRVLKDYYIVYKHKSDTVSTFKRYRKRVSVTSSWETLYKVEEIIIVT